MYAVVEMSSWVAVLVWAHRIGGVASVGLLAGSMLGAAALVAPLAATFAERFRRGPALAASHAVIAGALVGAAVTAGGPSTVPAFIALLVAVAAQSVIPSLHGASVPRLASGPTDVVAVNVASVTVQGVAVFVGPALAAALMLFGGPELVFWAGAGLSGVGVAFAVGLQAGEEATPHHTRFTDALRLVRSVLRNPEQRLLLGLGGAEMVVVAALDVLVVVVALEVWEAGESGAGLAVATLGVGSIVGGGIAAGLITRSRLVPSIVWGAFIRSAAMLGLAFASGAVATALVVVAGVGFSVIDVASRTLLQKSALPDSMARAFGLFESLQVAGYAAGTFAVPLLADAFGVPAALVGVGVAFPLLIVMRLRALNRLEDEAVASADEVRLIRSSPLLGALPPPSQERLAHRGAWVVVEPGERLIEEGAVSSEVYLVKDGSLEVSKNGDAVALLGPGSVVGEIAPLRGSVRTATVVARTRVTALRFAGPRFVEAVRIDGAGWSEADELAERRRSELDDDG